MSSPTGTPSGARPVRRPVVIAALVAVLSLLALAVLHPVTATSAAWTDDVVASSDVAAGTWDDGGGGDGGDGPIVPGNDDTIVSDVTWDLRSAEQFCVSLDVTTTSTTPVDWAVDVDSSQAPFNGGFPSQDNMTGAVVLTEPGADGVGTVGGTTADWENAAWDATINNHSVVAGQTAKAKLCEYDAGEPAIVQPGDDTYTYVTTLEESGINKQVCTSTTVTGHSDFYVGTEIVVDWSDVLDEALADGQITQDEYDYFLPLDLAWWDSGGPWTATQDGDTYTVQPSEGSVGSVIDGQTFVVRGCSG